MQLFRLKLWKHRKVTSLLWWYLKPSVYWSHMAFKKNILLLSFCKWNVLVAGLGAGNVEETIAILHFSVKWRQMATNGLKWQSDEGSLLMERRIRTTINHLTTLKQCKTAHPCSRTNNIKPDSEEKYYYLKKFLSMPWCSSFYDLLKASLLSSYLATIGEEISFLILGLCLMTKIRFSKLLFKSILE